MHNRNLYIFTAKEALQLVPAILYRWLPEGRIMGNEYVALNPRRNDTSLGSFKVNLRTGKWSDFAVNGAQGNDLISLAAYLFGYNQFEAAELIQTMIRGGRNDYR